MAVKLFVAAIAEFLHREAALDVMRVGQVAQVMRRMPAQAIASVNNLIEQSGT